MTKFQNMRIEINEQQPLDEVVKELERLGYVFNCGCEDHEAKMVIANSHYEQFDIYEHLSEVNTTIAQLKAMEK